MRQSYRDIVLADRPRAYWPMNHAVLVSNAPATDVSGHGHHATYTNGELRVPKASPRAMGGRAFDHVGSAWFQWPASANQSVANFSRECWISTTSSAVMFLLAQYQATNGEDFWRFYGNDTHYIFMYNGGFIYDSGDGSVGGVPARRQNIHDGRPHHLAYTRANGGRARIWVDADLLVDIGGGTSASTLLSSCAGSTARQLVDNVNNFNGVISDAAIYDYELSRDQILRHYQAGRGLLRGVTRRAA